jgi:hypothetical protein
MGSLRRALRRADRWRAVALLLMTPPLWLHLMLRSSLSPSSFGTVCGHEIETARMTATTCTATDQFLQPRPGPFERWEDRRMEVKLELRKRRWFCPKDGHYPPSDTLVLARWRTSFLDWWNGSSRVHFVYYNIAVKAGTTVKTVLTSTSPQNGGTFQQQRPESPGHRRHDGLRTDGAWYTERRKRP